MGVAWETTISDIWQSVESFISLCNVKITIEMTEILELEKHGYKTRLQNHSFSVNSCLDYPVNLPAHI